MGFYSQIIFPRFLDAVMSNSILTSHRQDLLAQVAGNVLEIGFGTGLNLPYYPAQVEKLTAIDPNPGVNKIAQQRLEKASIAVEIKQLSGENLPLADNYFDFVVSTWTLCSIPNVKQALAEIYRVLQPGGSFIFIEHGLSPDAKVQVWQQRLNPLQKRLADGCHLNRNIEQLIKEANFKLLKLDNFYLEQTPKFVGYSYQGIASK